MTEKQIQEEIYAFVDLCVALSEKMTWIELASKSGLSASTIKKIWKRETRYPRYQTLRKLGLAVGVEITFSQKKVKMKLVA